MGSFIFELQAALEILTFKVRKWVDFFKKIFPNEIPESGDKISNFWVFKIAF